MILSVTNNSNHNNIVESSTPLQIKKFMETFVTNINSLINNINIAYNKNQLISYQISILINSFTNQIEFISNDNFSVENQIESQSTKSKSSYDIVMNHPTLKQIISIVLTQNEINEMCTICHSIHLINHHITIAIFDYISEYPIIEINSSSLVLPKMIDVVKEINSFISKQMQQDVHIDNNQVMFMLKNGIEILIMFHNKFMYSIFDLIIYNNRQLIYNKGKNDENNLYKAVIDFINENWIFNVVDKGKSIAIKKGIINGGVKNLNTINNLSFICLVNINTNNENECKNNVETIKSNLIEMLNELGEELNNKIKVFMENSNLCLNFSNIVSALETVYQCTDNEQLYNNLHDLFTNSNPQELLYKDFMSHVCS